MTEQKRHNNRNSKRNNRRDKYKEKEDRGNQQLAEDQITNNQDYRLDWFKPTENQKEIIISMCQNDLTAVHGSSGSGKSTTVIWQALQDLKRGYYRKILFIKTPDESSDDRIGFLPSGIEDKLSVHFESMRSIFHSFMTKEKLAMEEKHEKITFNIPNFIKGMTFDNTLLLVDETQSISPKILKLILERVGRNSRVVLMGDKFQCYSATKRADGFTDFLNKITTTDENGKKVSKEGMMGYIGLTAKDNMRSDLSKRIVELYEEGV